MSYSGYGRNAGGSLLFTVILFLGFGVLMIAAQWRLFTKAGEPGWKCLIPFYGQYTWCKIVWSGKVFWALMGVSFGTGILSSVLTGIAANSYYRTGRSSGAILPAILLVAASIVSLVIAINMVIHTAHAYGKSGGFAAGLFFLMPIFLCILAFGNSEYVGPMGVPDGTRTTAGPFGSDGWEGQESADAGASAVISPSAHKLIWIVIGVCALILGIGTVTRVIMSMEKYSPMRGIFSSPWVGMQNFELVLRQAGFSTYLINSVIYGFFAVVVTLLFSLLGGAAGMSGSRSGKAIMAAVGAAIAFVPATVYGYMMVLAGMVRGGGFNPLLPIVHALPYGGVGMMLGALLPGVWPQNRFRGVMIAPLLTLASFFMDSAVGSVMENALNRQYSTTISSYIFNMTFLGKYALGGAMEVIQSLLNLIPAVAGALGIALLMKKARPVTVPSGKKKAGVSVLAGGIAGGLVLLTGIALFTCNSEIMSNASVTRALGSSLIAAGLVALLAFGVYLGVLVCAGKFNAERWFPFALLILLAVGFNRTSIVEYLISRNLGLLNTIIMPVLCAVVNPLSVMLMIGMVILRPQRTSTCVLLALGAACLSAAFVMGDISSYRVYVMDNSLYNLGMLIYNVVMNASFVAENANAAAGVNAVENLRLSLIGITLMAVSLPVGVGAAFCVHAADREN